MKPLLRSVLAAFFCITIVFLSGCGSSHNSSNSEPATFALNTDTTFQVGETRRVENTNTSIKLDAVTDDPRCGNCFSGGGPLNVRFLVSDGAEKGNALTLPLYFKGASDNFLPIIPATQNRPAYRVVTQQIVPQNQPINAIASKHGFTEKYLPQAEYKITVRLTAL